MYQSSFGVSIDFATACYTTYDNYIYYCTVGKLYLLKIPVCASINIHCILRTVSFSSLEVP